MRKLTLALNALSAVLFLAFFAYTFVARAHLESMAREFVTQKTLEYSGPIIDAVEEALDLPLFAKLFSRDDIQIVRNEIDTYRKAPATYIADLTGKRIAPAGELGPIAQKAADAKQQIRQFYENTLAALISDLRLFSGTNIVAAILALLLVVKSRDRIRKSLVACSFLLFVAVLFCSYLYIDDLSFFRIVTSSHMGWWYPGFVIFVAFRLYANIGGAVEAVA